MISPWQRIRALLLHEVYLTRHSIEMLFDLIIFPMINVVLFGFIANFIGVGNGDSATYLILGVLLWQVIAIVQYSVSVSTMWSVWSHNLTNIFVAPVTVAQYLSAHAVAAVLRGLIIVGVLSVGTYLIFDFNILQIGVLSLVLAFINLSIFAFWLGIILLGLIFRFGTRIQAVAWGTVYLFQPLTASFFPVSALPGALQVVAHSLPPTYVFEAARTSLTTHTVDWANMGVAFAMNAAYFVAAVLIFRHFYKRSRTTGQFARNDLG